MDKFQLQMPNVLLFIITYKLFTRSQVIKKWMKNKNVSQILQLSARFNTSVMSFIDVCGCSVAHYALLTWPMNKHLPVYDQTPRVMLWNQNSAVEFNS